MSSPYSRYVNAVTNFKSSLLGAKWKYGRFCLLSKNHYLISSIFTWKQWPSSNAKAPPLHINLNIICLFAQLQWALFVVSVKAVVSTTQHAEKTYCGCYCICISNIHLKTYNCINVTESLLIINIIFSDEIIWCTSNLTDMYSLTENLALLYFMRCISPV